MTARTYILAATPTEPSRLKKFFESGDASVRTLLEHPGQLRYAGWDLQTDDKARIIRGEYLEVKSGDKKILHLYEDGTFIVRAAADETFLAWATSKSRDKKNLRLHPIALIEFTYSFAAFYARLTPHFETARRHLNMRVEFQNAIIDDAKLFLNPGEVGSITWGFNEDPYFAPDPSVKTEIEIKTNRLQQNPARVGYQLIEKVYVWFGIDPKWIPYTAVDGENRIIDIAQLGKKKS